MLDKSKKHYKELIKILVEARKSKGVTQVELGKRIGKRQTFVSKFELCERRLDILEFVIICKAIGVSPNTIIKKSKIYSSL